MKKGIKIIGVYETLGGLVGVGILLWVGLQGFFDSRLGSILIVLFAFLMYILSIISGYLILKGRYFGLLLSRFIQVIQIPIFSIGGLSYLFVSGILLSVHLSSNGSNMAAGSNVLLGSKFNITFPPQPDSTTIIGINIIALIAFLYLFKQTKDSLNPTIAEYSTDNGIHETDVLEETPSSHVSELNSPASEGQTSHLN